VERGEKMNKKYTYESVKQFIEIESNTGCILISKEYINYDLKLEIKCKCGNHFFISFSKFKGQNKRQCNKCSNLNRWNIDNIKYFIEVESQSGCKLISHECKNANEKLELQCKCGNHFFVNIYKFKNRNKRRCNECSKKTNWDVNKVRNYLLSLGFELLSKEYIDVDTNITFKDSLGYLYYSTLSTMIVCKKSRFVDKSNPYTIHNIKLWCRLNNKSFILVSKIYEGNNKKLKWQCLKPECGEIFELKWGHISQGIGCGMCAGHQVGLSNCLATKYPKLTKEWHPILNNDLTPFDVTCGLSQKVWWICKKCSCEWMASIGSRTNKGCGCPKCNESKGEKQLDYILTQYNIPHDSQYTFDDLRGIGGRVLKFDVPIFWDIEKTKLKMLIEFDGIFHYEKQYEDDGFETLQIHDKRKNQYCKNNNIKLLRIPYWDFDNIEKILQKELNLIISEVVSI